MQQGDVRLFDTIDGGEISVVSGVTDMDGGLETAAYLALFGGNKEDPAGDDTSLSWWGNILEDDPAFKYRSEFQYLLDTLPATTSNLTRLKEAAERDLSFFVDMQIASSVSVSISYPAINRIDVVINIEADNRIITIKFEENWKAST